MPNSVILAWIALALILIPVQLQFAAPYGRHSSTKWGPTMPNKAGWIIMELMALGMFLWSFLRGSVSAVVPWIVAALFTLHYVHRSIIYPLMTRTGKKRIPILIVIFALMFNSVNGYINGDYLGAHSELYPVDYLGDRRFLIGVALFILGATINIRADYQLIRLRNSSDSGYSIPTGSLFKRISCPNHLGEIVEWTGFAILCWNLPALAFAVWTASNLIPRAIHHHRWYRKKFPEYPAERKAVIPFLI